jgi:8-oxo-dGTP diphosphatase
MAETRALATDAVVLVDGEVVLLERDHPPHEGDWVLPGGIVDPDETAAEACVRETGEEVGLAVDIEEFVGLYDDPDRDERGFVSAAYLCRPRGAGTPTPQAEARRVATFPPTGLPAMGFDHAAIVADAVGAEAPDDPAPGTSLEASAAEQDGSAQCPNCGWTGRVADLDGAGAVRACPACGSSVRTD